MKFFTRRQMRSIHKGQMARQERALRMRSEEQSPAVRQPVVKLLSGNLDRLVVVVRRLLKKSIRKLMKQIMKFPRLY